MRFRAIGIIALGEEMGVQVRRGLSTHPEAQTIVEVLRDEGVDGADIELTGFFPRAGLQVILEEGLEHEDGVLKAFQLLEVVEESAHARLVPGELHLTVLLPESIAAIVGATLHLQRVLALETLLRQRVEGEVGLTGGARHHSLLYPLRQHQFHNHIIDGEQPLTVVLLGELLHTLHRLHPVDVGGTGEHQFTALHLIGRVIEDVQLSTEAIVLDIVRQEIEVDTAVIAHIDCVGNIVAVELDGITPDGRTELMAQQQDIVVVDIHIGKHLTHHGGQDLACLEQVVDTTRTGTLHDGTLSLRILPPELFGDHLIDRQRQHQLVGVLTAIHLFAQPRVFLEHPLLQRLRLQVVQTETNLLVVLVTVVVVALQVGLLLVGNHLAHQFHGRVFLTTVTRFLLRLHRHLLQRLVVGSQSDGHLS